MIKHILYLSLTLITLIGCYDTQKDISANQVNNSVEANSMSNKTITGNSKREIVAFSTDKGLTWKPLNEGLPDNTQASFIDKIDNGLVLATDNQGVFKTENNQSNWINIGAGLPTLKINALYTVGDEIYVGLYQHGVFKSDDIGITWQSNNDGLPNLNVRAILKVNNNLIVGTDNGIFKTQNGQKNWNLKSSNDQISSLNEFKGIQVAGTTKGVLLSVDKGETWKQIHAGGAIHTTAFIDNAIYAMYVSGDVFRSNDLGVTWSKYNYFPNRSSYIYEFTKIGNDLLMSNNYGLFKSTDNGQNWNNYLQEERYVFFDFLVVDNVVYGATRIANEFRNRK